MAIPIQITMDAADPAKLGAFWIVALGYAEPPPPQDFPTWDAFLESIGVPVEERKSAYAIADPEGVGPRVFIQQVPEGKSAKNRVHLDVNVSMSDGEGTARDRIWAHARTLEKLGATISNDFEKLGSYWLTMFDPEGNEFCIQ